MKKFLLFTILIALSALCFGQEVETVSERFHYRYLKKEQTKEQIQKDIVDKIKEYIEDKIDELSDISL